MWERLALVAAGLATAWSAFLWFTGAFAGFPFSSGPLSSSRAQFDAGAGARQARWAALGAVLSLVAVLLYWARKPRQPRRTVVIVVLVLAGITASVVGMRARAAALHPERRLERALLNFPAPAGLVITQRHREADPIEKPSVEWVWQTHDTSAAHVCELATAALRSWAKEVRRVGSAPSCDFGAERTEGGVVLRVLPVSSSREPRSVAGDPSFGSLAMTVAIVPR